MKTLVIDCKGGGTLQVRRIRRTERQRIASAIGLAAGVTGTELKFQEVCFRAAVVKAEGVNHPETGADVCSLRRVSERGIDDLASPDLYDAVQQADIEAALRHALGDWPDEAQQGNS